MTKRMKTQTFLTPEQITQQATKIQARIDQLNKKYEIMTNTYMSLSQGKKDRFSAR